MGFFIRPKDTNKDGNHFNAEAILPAQDGVENEYIPTTGFDASTHGKSGADHRRDPVRREAAPSNPLPAGNWRGGGTRTGRIGTRRG